MSCPHKEATLLWLYGEGDEAHAEHVASCAECTLIAAEHADMVAMVRPIAHRLEATDRLAVPEPANQSFSRMGRAMTWLGSGGVLALVAAALLVMFLPSSPSIPSDATDTEVAVIDTDVLFSLDELDVAFDDLDDALDELEDDLFTL